MDRYDTPVNCTHFASNHKMDEMLEELRCELLGGFFHNGRCIIEQYFENVPTPIGESNAEFGRVQTTYKNPNKTIRKAIEDADWVLSEDPNCRSYFGKYGKDALAFLDQKLEEGIVDSVTNVTTGIKQTFPEPPSPTTIIGKSVVVEGQLVSAQAYRESTTAIVNTKGPFFNAFAPKIGNYNSAQQESRVLQILHEIAHLLYKSDGLGRGNLIPNDGGSGQTGISAANTEEVKKACKNGIEALKKRK